MASVTTSLQEQHLKLCSLGRVPNFGTVRNSRIAWPQFGRWVSDLRIIAAVPTEFNRAAPKLVPRARAGPDLDSTSKDMLLPGRKRAALDECGGFRGPW
jgi:hypothetical protein